MGFHRTKVPAEHRNALRRSDETTGKAHALAARVQRDMRGRRRTMGSSTRRCALALLATACAALAWSSTCLALVVPQKLASSRTWRYGRPIVASNPAGDTAIEWRRENELNETLSGVEATTRRRGSRSWSPPTVLKATPQGGAYAPQLSIDSGGNVDAIWHGVGSLEAAERPATGSWASAGFISRAGEEVETGQSARLAAARREAKVVFLSRQGRMFTIQVATRGPQGWRAPHRLASSQYPFQQPQIAVDASGRAVVAWVRAGRGSRALLQTLALRANGKTTGSPRTVASRRGRIRELHLAANARGEVVLLWRFQAGKATNAVEAASGALNDARFTRAAVVARGSDSELTGTIDAQGEAIVGFTHAASARPPTVQAATRLRHGRWSTPRPIVPGRGTTEPQLSADPSGGPPVAVWTAGPPGSHTGTIEASVSDSRSRWQAPLVLSGPGGFSPSVAVSASGGATAAWISEVPAAAGTETLETADFARP